MNEQNLIPITQRSESEQREMRSKGGRNSGETRRRKKSMRSAMRELMALPVQDMETWNALAAMGVDPGQMDNQMALLASVLAKGIRTGDVKAMLAVAAVAGEDNDAERLKLQKKQAAALEKKQNDNGALADILDALRKGE